MADEARSTGKIWRWYGNQYISGGIGGEANCIACGEKLLLAFML